MNEPSPERMSGLTVTEGGDASTARPGARWLRFCQIGWVVVTLTLLVLDIISFSDIDGAFFSYTPTVLRELHQVGLSPTLYSAVGIILNVLMSQIVFMLLGVLLFLRRPNDLMALFCAFTLVTFGSAVNYFNFSSGDVVPALAANPIVHVVALVLFAAGETSFVIFFYVFPSGRFAPHWTRWAALIVVAYYVAVVFFPALPSNAGGPATYAIPLFLLTAVVAQIYRYRRISTAREQEQTKWVVFGFALAILLLALNFPIDFLLPETVTSNQVLSNLNPVFPVALMMVPVFIVIAILRSRLWDIDTLINRALVYGSLTALLAALYAGLIIGLQHLTGLVARIVRLQSSHPRGLDTGYRRPLPAAANAVAILDRPRILPPEV